MRPHIFMFLIIFFMCGSIWGFLESYLFWFLEDLGSTKLTMGISLAVGTIAGIPLTIASGAIIKKLGSVIQNHDFIYYKIIISRNTNVITVALFIYSFRLLGYSFINLPLESLVFEVEHNSMKRNFLAYFHILDIQTIWQFSTDDCSDDLCQE